MPQLQPGEYTKQSAADLLGWNSAVDVPQPGTARLYYNSFTDAVHIINSNGDELLVAGGDVTSVFSRTGMVTAEQSDYAAYYLEIDPTGDQTITGSYQLINRGTNQTGPDLSTFNSEIQDQAFYPSSGEVGVSGQVNIPSPSSGSQAGVQGIAQGAGAIGVWGLASETVAGTRDFLAGGAFQSFLITTADNPNSYAAGVGGGGIGEPAVGTILGEAIGVYGQATNYGLGTITKLCAIQAQTNTDNLSGPVTASYGLDCLAQTVGTTNAAVHSVDQGGSVNNYGILFEGVTHNKLGGGYTQVGALAIPSVTASTSSNIAVTFGIVEATGGVAGITLSTQSASLVSGQIVTVKKVDAGAGAVTLTDLAAANFDGDSSYILVDQWQYVTIQWNGTRFNVIGNN